MFALLWAGWIQVMLRAVWSIISAYKNDMLDTREMEGLFVKR